MSCGRSLSPLIPNFEPRRQGGGMTAVDDRAVFTAIVCVLTSECAWRHLPAEFGLSVPTAHRRIPDPDLEGDTRLLAPGR
ncbi:transposase [Spirillospora sp. CA-255316]